MAYCKRPLRVDSGLGRGAGIGQLQTLGVWALAGFPRLIDML
jgi:hypothetical protein